MTTLIRRQTATAYDKPTRLTQGHPRRRLLNSPVRHRLVRPSWRSAAERLIKENTNLNLIAPGLARVPGRYTRKAQPPSRLPKQT